MSVGYVCMLLWSHSVGLFLSMHLLSHMLCYMIMYAYDMNMNMLLCLNLAINLCEHTAMFNHSQKAIY